MFLVGISRATSLGGVFWSEKVLGVSRGREAESRRGRFSGYGAVPGGITGFRKLS